MTFARVQELLGHRDVSTTTIDRGAPDVWSPMDRL